MTLSESNLTCVLYSNTEACMLIGTLPENSYRVLLDNCGNLVWVIKNEDREVRYYKEPKTSFSKRFRSSLIKLLPIQSQL